MNKQDNLKRMFWPRIFSAIIDIVLIYCISFLIYRIVIQLIYIDFFVVFSVCWLLYFIICYLFLNGQTLSKKIVGLQIKSNANGNPGIIHIIIREIAKFCILLVLSVRINPAVKAQFLGTILFILLFFIITIVVFFLSKKPWWELLSGTKTTNSEYSSLRLTSFISIAGIFIITIFVKFYPFISDFQKFRTTFYPKFPINSETKKYAEFIKSHLQDPVDYIFNLFEKYDLVVLSERMHAEYTQYEFISKIISDKRFADKVGNIYTENGSVSFQDTLNNFLHTIYTNEDSLDLATAILQRNSDGVWPIWENTNRFDLLKHVNKINSSLNDSLKINFYFTDIPVNWEKMTPSGFLNQYHNNQRDKIMANNILKIYKEKSLRKVRRMKGLIIMNTRHGFGLIRDENGKKADHYFNDHSTAAFLMDSLPEKVCNVLINTVASQFGTFTPLQHGKWDRAFSLVGNPNIGFNFENSPFGTDNFDSFSKGISGKLEYKDVFTGFVFYKPLEQHIDKRGFPYMLYNFEDSLIRRSRCINTAYAERIKNDFVPAFRKEPIVTNQFYYAEFYNIIVNIGFALFVAVILLVSVILFLIKKRTISQKSCSWERMDK